MKFDDLSVEEIGKLFPIHITPYHSDWKTLFEEENNLITNVLGKDILFSIEHFGSTSVEGLAAKPTIDILVEVSELDDELKQKLIQKLSKVGYENMYDAEKEDKMTFGKGYNENYLYTQSYHLHIREKGVYPQDEMYFRDSLRENPYIRDEYEKLKYSLAEKYKNNREAYTQGKTEFIKRITKQQKQKMSKILIREIKKKEIGKLEDMLYEAIYQPDENNLIPRTVLEIPEIYAYIKDFGDSKDDCCFVADLDGEIVGAVWVRIISDDVKGYGYIDDSTPEFAISLYKEYRNRGIGTQLMSAMIKHLSDSGYSQTSLNVKKDNYAVKLYQNVGFEIVSENEEDYLMLLKLDSNIPKTIALKFNDCITHADIEGLSALMTEDHVFIDMANNRIEGKDNNIVQTWNPFFNLYPGYRNIFENIIERKSTVIMQGYSICSDQILNNIRAIWVAEIINNKVSLWHIYSDTKENREIFNL